MGSRDDLINSELKNVTEGRHSIIRNRKELNDGYNSTGVAGCSNLGESSDDYYGVVSDSDIVLNERYKSDAKLRKGCTVVITPTKELIQFERKRRNAMYNEILQNQRKKLELRALEKQKEKERKRQQTKSIRVEPSAAFHNSIRSCDQARNYHEILMSSESEYETSFQLRTRKQSKTNFQKMEPLNIQIGLSEATTSTLLSQIDAHLDKQASEISHPLEVLEQQQDKQTNNYNINQQICDINNDKSRTKMTELNLLADIAQHLSPYQLDTPENNNQPNSPSPAPELQPTSKPVHQKSNDTEVPQEKVTVTEQVFIQSLDNPLEKRKQQLDNNDQQKASASYAHEPKLNIATIFKPSPCANLLQKDTKQSNTQIKINDNQVNPKAQTEEILEQILEESISVLTVTSPYNPLNEYTTKQQQVNSNTSTPILISNVESLHQSEESDKANQNCNVKKHVIQKNTTKSNSENLLLTEKQLHNKEETNVQTKDVTENDSNASKSFRLHIPKIGNCVINDVLNNEISIPDLSLVMSNITQHTTLPTNQQHTLDSSFNQLNCTLSTPIKETTIMSSEVGRTNSSKNDVNTPLKSALQSEVEPNNVPLKNTLETETDSNVTKFLDLILNKTVSDAESETRDKIIKELNALTADTAEISDMSGNCNNGETVSLESKPDEIESNKYRDSENQFEANKYVVKKSSKENLNELKQSTSLNTDSNKSDQNSEYSLSSRIKCDASVNEISEPKTSLKEQRDSRTPSPNNELNPPKINLEENSTELLKSDITFADLSDPSTQKLSNTTAKVKGLAINEIFNTPCRVRLKRVNSKITKKKPMSTEKLVSSKVIKCDIVTEKPPRIKKPCLKTNNKNVSKELQDGVAEKLFDETTKADVIPAKKPKFEIEKPVPIFATQTALSDKLQTQTFTQTSQASDVLINNTSTTVKPKTKLLKTVTFDLSNLNEELRDNTASNHKQKSKSHAPGITAGALGFFGKNSRPPRKLHDNTLRAAETLQLFVNSINASTRTPPSAEFNKKRSPIKNKCIAEDETPRPPPASTLMGTPPCKKTCTEKIRSHLSTSKCKDQLVSSLTTTSISSITNDISTARIYTSSPLDQTLPEYDDNVDTVADSELILPTTTGSLRRKLKRPKKSMSKPEPADDASTDDINNQPECNGEDDTDPVVDNEDDVFAEELLPIPAANEHILEEIVSARTTHIGTGTVIRDDYMNIEATATVPVYLFNDESRDLGSPEILQSTENINVVDSSSNLNTSSTAAPNNVAAATPASTLSAIGNLEKSMLSPSEHEVSSTQETFYQTPIKNKQTEIFEEKSTTCKEKGNSSLAMITNNSLKQKPDDNGLKSKENYQTSSTIGLLQNNQVDTTNHSPEMCTLALTATTTTTPTLTTNNRKIRKASTHDEILFNELQQQQQLPSTKRKLNNPTFCVESTSDNISNAISKSKVVANNLEDIKSNGTLANIDDKFKKLLKDVCKTDKKKTTKEPDVGLSCAINNTGGGGSSPSTTTTINEEYLSRSKRKKLKYSKSKKTKSHGERSSKIVLKASKLTPHIPANPLIITIPKSRLLKPPPALIQMTQDEQQHSEFFDTPNAKLFIEKDKEPTATAAQKCNHHSLTQKELINISNVATSKSNHSQSPGNISSELENTKLIKIVDTNRQDITHNTKSTTAPSCAITIKNKEIINTTNDTSSSNTISMQSNNNLIFVKDKYDLIKSKDKSQHHNNQNQQDTKEKSKDKARSRSNSSRSQKTSAKDKAKAEKVKEKPSKSTEKPSISQQQPHVLKLNNSQNNNKPLSSDTSSSADLSTTVTFSSSNSKQINNKSSKTNSSSSSSSSSLSSSALHKSKTNTTTTQSAGSAIASANSPSQTVTATLSTNKK